MKKVAVITLQSIKNYGSVLQTYATQLLIEGIGADCEIINYVRKDNIKSNIFKNIIKTNSFPVNILKMIVLMPTLKQTEKIFGNYLSNNIHLSTNIYYSEEDLEKEIPEADIYVTGSDQVWNSIWNGGLLPEFFLKFAPKNRKKISFSSSIGTNNINDSEKNEMQNLLKEYNAISVRENSAIETLKNIDINDVIRIIDPTLLITRESWSEKASKRIIKDNYVLIYQLNRNKKFDIYAKKFAKKYNCKLIRICLRYDQIRLPGKSIVIPDVSEFLSLIKYSSYIITDSFHATAFALNFNKEFVSIYPNNFSSRINDILIETHTLDRHLTNYFDFDLVKRKIDFEYINHYLDKERKNAIEFLERNIKDE